MAQIFSRAFLPRSPLPLPLPAAPKGWTRKNRENNDMSAAMSMMGGNAATMGYTIVRIGREKFVDRDGGLFTRIGKRIMAQVTGDADRDVVVETLKNIDFRGLKSFEG